jgi:hypothetical protein
MIPKVIIISNKEESSIERLIDTLHEFKLDCLEIIDCIERLKAINLPDFRGFFIFYLPPAEIGYWIKNLRIEFLNYFKVYCYDYLMVNNINTSEFLVFDFINAGEQEHEALQKHLAFLKDNYWRKIPLSKLGLKKIPDSGLLNKIFYILEHSDIISMTQQKLSNQLNVRDAEVRLELKKHLNLSFSRLRSMLIAHYQEFSANNFVID